VNRRPSLGQPDVDVNRWRTSWSLQPPSRYRIVNSRVTWKKRVREFVAQGREERRARLARDSTPCKARVTASPQVVARKADKQQRPGESLLAQNR
jgi:hypothetical protein